MGFTSIMSSNRFGSPRFPNEGSAFNFNDINEFQDPFNYHHLGKPPPPPPPSSSNMNVFDEYLKSLVTTTMDDEKLNQKFMVKNNASTSSSSSSPQSSVSVNLNRTPSNKGLHELWNELIQRNHGNVVDGIKDESVLGGKTLEEYLIVQNGDINPVINNQDITVNPQPLINIDPMVAVSQEQPDWLQFPVARQIGVMGCLPVSGSSFENPAVVDVGHTDNQLSLSVPMPMNGTTSSNPQAVAEKKRLFSDEMMENTIDRRQKRMLKNRESAARSRARKQQHTNDLELKVVALRRMNKILMKDKELLLQMQEMLLRKTDPKLCPKYQLRRSHSALF